MNYSLITFVHNVQSFMIKLNIHLTHFSKKGHLSHLCATPSLYSLIDPTIRYDVVYIIIFYGYNYD